MCRLVTFSGTCTQCAGPRQTWRELTQQLSCLEAKNAGQFGACGRGVDREDHAFDQQCEECEQEDEAIGILEEEQQGTLVSGGGAFFDSSMTASGGGMLIEADEKMQEGKMSRKRVATKDDEDDDGGGGKGEEDKGGGEASESGYAKKQKT